LNTAWKAPLESAASLEEGEVRLGLDGQSKWKVVSIRSSGAHRWCRTEPKPFTSKAGVARVDPDRLFSKAQNAEDILNAVFEDGYDDDTEEKELDKPHQMPTTQQMPTNSFFAPTSAPTTQQYFGTNTSDHMQHPAVGWHKPPPKRAPTQQRKTTKSKANGSSSSSSSSSSTVCDMDIEEEPPINTRGQSKNTNSAFRWNDYHDPNNIFA